MDGKFIERVGSYNPNTNPATINLNFERALYWLTTGAQPTDTVRNILSNEGVLLKKHLLGGVKKGAFSAEEAEKRFEAWLKNKQSATEAAKAKLNDAKAIEAKKRLEAEQEERQHQRQQMDISRMLTESDGLTSELVDLLIDKIYVYPDKRVDVEFKIRDSLAAHK